MVEAVKAGEWTGTVDSFPALAGEVAMETVLRLTGKQALPLSAGKGDGLRAILLGQPGLRPALRRSERSVQSWQWRSPEPGRHRQELRAVVVAALMAASVPIARAIRPFWPAWRPVASRACPQQSPRSPAP
jgi:hypothetical protein